MALIGLAVLIPNIKKCFFYFISVSDIEGGDGLQLRKEHTLKIFAYINSWTQRYASLSTLKTNFVSYTSNWRCHKISLLECWVVYLLWSINDSLSVFIKSSSLLKEATHGFAE